MSTLSAKHFHDEAAAFAELESIMWPNGPVCPHCGSDKRIYDLKGVRSKPSKKHPEGVTDWLADDEQEITRGTVRLLKEFLNSGSGEGEGEGGDDDTPPAEPAAPKEKEEKEADPDKLKKAIVTVEHDGRPGRLMLNRRPSREGASWMKYDDDGSEFEAELADVRLISVIEG